MNCMTGYYIYQYGYKLSARADQGGGTTYYKVRAPPPQYYFAKYTLDILLFSSSAVRFNTTDSIVITDTDGYVRDFPQVQTFKDSGFTQATRSEEHTSELQSRPHLVCRLLLEKKNDDRRCRRS